MIGCGFAVPTGDDMETLELFQRLSVAFAIGLLIGLERGWQERTEREGGRTLGLRTLALTGLLGGIWGAIARAGGPGGYLALGLAFVIYSLAIGVFRFRETQAEKTFGATTLVAAMTTFALGAYALIGDQNAAAAAGVVVAALLALKRLLHDWLRRLTWIELRSVLVLLAMTFILLPLLPDRAVPELGGLNPYEIWLLTIMIAAISFAGYVAVRLVGETRGIVITAVSAGLVSSTAVTVTLARLAGENPERNDLLTGGALLAGVTMVLRVLVVVAIINSGLLAGIGPPLVAGAAVLAAGAFVLIRRRGSDGADASGLTLSNPFELPTVLKFGALLAAIMLATKLVAGAAGKAGLIALAALSGIADVDAITLSMARQVGGSDVSSIGAMAILTAVGVNTISKAVLALSTGGRGPGVPMLVVSAIAVAASVGVLLALQAFW